MVRKPTLLILGAGTAMPYGFPNGTKLRSDIIANVAQPPSLTIMRELAIAPGAVEAFRDAFEWSHDSIDGFLFHRPEFSEIGKFAIAQNLIPLEGEGHLLRAIHGFKHWYAYLWSRLSDRPWDEWTDNAVRIVTFNYDRSLEAFLTKAIIAKYKRSPEEALSALRHLAIKHVYGDIGRFGFSFSPSEDVRPFSSLVNPDTVRVAAGGIRTIHERDQNTACLEAIALDMQWAKQLCFLGFSYDRENLKRLGVSRLRKRKAEGGSSFMVYGTSLGLEEGERLNALTAMGADPHFFLPQDSETFLRHFRLL